MITSKKKSVYNKDPLDEISDYTLPELLEFYEDRNEKTKYEF